jgi:BirA family transcriptional regulator, biotin operon repressor / biotin---[acetyl-CoA-carboxylase] ligase
MEIIYKHFESLTSTNDWVKGHLKTIPEGVLLCVSADEQTAARGQYGRKWFSPKGENLYATFGFLTEQRHDPLTLTRLLAIATARTLEERGVRSILKWPNDLLVHQKKIAGILCETIPLPQRIGIAIGVGLNVNMSQENLVLIDQPATSLLAETGHLHPIPEIKYRLAEHFATDLTFYRPCA